MEVITKVFCPFCGKELVPFDNTVDHGIPLYACTNPECEESEDLIGTIEIWSNVIILADEMKKLTKGAKDGKSKSK